MINNIVAALKLNSKFCNILPVIIIFGCIFLTNLVRSNKKNPSITLYRLVNIFVYTIELYSATTVINYLINQKTFIHYQNAFTLVSDFILAFTIYQFFINIFIQIWDGVIIDGFLSLKRVVNLLLLRVNTKPELIEELKTDFENNLKLLKSDAFGKEQHTIINEITTTTDSYIQNKMSINDYRFFLENKLLLIDHAMDTINLGWQSSLLLRVLK